MKRKTKLQLELEYEKSLPQDEIIEFEYFDRISHKKVIIKDKRSIKVTLLEFEEQGRLQRNERSREECRYNPKTDDKPDESQSIENILSKKELEEEEIRLNRESKAFGYLEDVMQELSNKICEMHSNQKKVNNFFKKYIFEFSDYEKNFIFFFYFLGFSLTDVSAFFNVSKSTLHYQKGLIEEKMKNLMSTDKENE